MHVNYEAQSLTNLLKGGLCDEIARLIPQPAFNESSNCRACPQTNNYGLVGTAFDYLIDIKTTKEKRLDNRTWSQLICYLILTQINCELGTKNCFPFINKVGIYYSRYGQVLLTDAKYILKHDNYRAVREALLKRAKASHEGN